MFIVDSVCQKIRRVLGMAGIHPHPNKRIILVRGENIRISQFFVREVGSDYVVEKLGSHAVPTIVLWEKNDGTIKIVCSNRIKDVELCANT